MEGYLRFKIDWPNLIVGSKLTVLLYFGLYLRAISKYKPPGAYIRKGDLKEGFLRYEFWGLIHGGAYFRNFTVALKLENDGPTFSSFNPCPSLPS